MSACKKAVGAGGHLRVAMLGDDTQAGRVRGERRIRASYGGRSRSRPSEPHGHAEWNEGARELGGSNVFTRKGDGYAAR